KTTAMFEAVMHPDPDRTAAGSLAAAGDDLLDKWLAFVSNLDGEVDMSRRARVGGLTFMPVRLPVGATEEASGFNPLRALRPMPRVRPAQPTVLRSSRGRLPRPAMAAAATVAALPRVAVFDAGVDDASPYFSQVVTRKDLTSRPDDPAWLAHGSGVTGAVAYGRLRPTDALLPPPRATVTHYRVHPGDDADVELYDLLDQIVTTVSNDDVSVVNLSLGPTVCVSDAEPDRWTAELDRLAYDRDVLFVAAVGNNGADSAPHDRVQVPGDMVNGLAVGAHTQEDIGCKRASYSPIGPGRPGNIISPTGLAFGGESDAPFHRLLGNGTLSPDYGTSYASPLVAGSLAQLAADLGRHASPTTLRAFAIHFAVPPDGDPRRLEVGHGKLREHYRDVLNPDPASVTILYHAELRRDEVIGFDLPVPETLARGVVKLTWTVAFTSPVEPTEAVEYTQMGIEPVFRPHSRIYAFRHPDDPSRVANVNLDADTALASQLLADGWQLSAHARARSGDSSLSELSRREDGKWETAWRTIDSLRAASLHRPRLDISYVARGGGALRRDVPPVELALLVTIATRGTTSLYTDVRTAFPVLTPLPAARLTARTRPRL
ncbi:MAG TPA: S8 family peptidase, partial [Jatrophihabitantaceae bacterium]|nr:S8 family peptidase [Jatrophihabitantaceae bacterium]